jgi:hypothetical protein
LSGLLATVGVSALQVDLFRVRLLHVLRGLLLAVQPFDRRPVFVYDSSLWDYPFFDKLYGSGLVAAGAAFRLGGKQRGFEDDEP